ncbi:unnamed protein product, partial [Scytosiphon promiscuus]
RQHGCPWGLDACSAATAGGGHLNVLQWARRSGFPWNSSTCARAARSGNPAVLQQARRNGC